MQVSSCQLGLFRMTMGREIEPHNPAEKNKFLNQLEEAFGFLCTHISWDILFHPEGLKTSKESWEKIESLFGKQDELRGKILESDLIALYPGSFKTIQRFFKKFKSLALQCKQCEIERKYEQLVLSVLRELVAHLSSPDHIVYIAVLVTSIL